MHCQVQLSVAEQRIIRFAIGWVIHETYGYTERTQLSEQDAQASSTLLELFQAWFAAGEGTLSVTEEGYRQLFDESVRVLPNGSLSLMRLSVVAFLKELVPIPREFEIIIGLPSAVGESLLSRLQAVDPTNGTGDSPMLRGVD